MQKLIIVRGHSGAGKSTFAKQKIAEFQQIYPNATIFHIENDHFLFENGEYIWTKSRFNAAKQQADQARIQAFEFAKINPNQAVLIVVSNVGIKRSTIEKLINEAKLLNLAVEVYRVQNFFRNQHGVSLNQALDMYLALEQNPIENEIFVPPIKPMSEAIKQRLNARFLQKNR